MIFPIILLSSIHSVWNSVIYNQRDTDIYNEICTTNPQLRSVTLETSTINRYLPHGYKEIHRWTDKSKSATVITQQGRDPTVQLSNKKLPRSDTTMWVIQDRCSRNYGLTAYLSLAIPNKIFFDGDQKLRMQECDCCGVFGIKTDEDPLRCPGAFGLWSNYSIVGPTVAMESRHKRSLFVGGAGLVVGSLALRRVNQLKKVVKIQQSAIELNAQINEQQNLAIDGALYLIEDLHNQTNDALGEINYNFIQEEIRFDMLVSCVTPPYDCTDLADYQEKLIGIQETEIDITPYKENVEEAERLNKLYKDKAEEADEALEKFGDGIFGDALNLGSLSADGVEAILFVGLFICIIIGIIMCIGMIILNRRI